MPHLNSKYAILLHGLRIIGRMSANDPLVPRKQSDLDEEIADAARLVKDIRRNRRVLILAFSGWAAIFALLVIIAVLKKSGGWGWGSGIFAYLAGSAVIFLGAYLKEEREGFSLEAIFDASRDLQQKILERRELAIGNIRGKAAVYARYREAMPDLIAHYRRQANSTKRANNSLQVFIIIGSLITSAITGLFGAHESVRVVAVGIGLTVAVASSMASYFKLREKSSQLQRTADQIEIEFRSVELGIGEYADLSQTDALRKFVEIVEDLRREHMTRQRQLDQPADLRYIDQTSLNVERPAQ